MSRGTISHVARVPNVATFWLTVRQSLYQGVGQEVLLVSPAQTLSRVFELSGQADFWISAGVSLYNVMAGFVCVPLLGIVLGVLCYRFRFLYQLIHPLLSAIKATPVASSITLALVRPQSVRVPAFIAGLIVLPTVLGNVCQGVAVVDRELLEMARVLRLGRWKTLQYIYLLTVVPYLAATFTTGIGLAWKAGVSVEVLANARNSTGGRVYGAKIYLDTVDLFAWTAVVIVLGVVLERPLLACFCRMLWGEGRF